MSAITARDQVRVEPAWRARCKAEPARVMQSALLIGLPAARIKITVYRISGF
ncbi:hypothetical protein ACQEVF_52850 [Nonomuraea polychroma]|uniref:hypothetical protein n=1 Tax=Nonomuraea polychroma TaxID=46176 RepID=UPI003D90FDB7